MNARRLRLPALGLGLLLHLAALAGLLLGGSIGWILPAHLAGAAAWGFGAAARGPGDWRAAFWLPAGCALVFPVLGPLGALYLMAGLRRRPVDNDAGRYVVWNAESLDTRAPPPPSTAVQSVIEILQSPRTQLRRNAILALRELEPAMAIPLLRKGLQDSDEQVRIFSQNILSAMLERFEARIKDLEEKLRTDIEAAATGRQLAEQYYELVYLDVAGDDRMAEYYLAKAIALLEHAAAAAPEDNEIALLGLKYALRARNAPLAQAWAERLGPSALEAQHVLPWRMELAFLEGDWTRLRQLLAAFAAAGHINPRLDEIIRFWSGEPRLEQ
jgi:hypothetical protein